MYKISFRVVTIRNYEGYWIQSPVDKLAFCSKQNGSILNCETELCTMNCHDAYEIQNVTITSKRDSNTIGNYSWVDGIHWANNITWTKKGKYKIPRQTTSFMIQ